MQLTAKQAKRLGLLDEGSKPPEKPPAKRQPSSASLSTPRAGQGERTGLSTMIKLGWSVQSPDSVRYRLFVINKPNLDTGLCADERSACTAAKALEKLR